MKKFMSIILALVMICSLSVSVFAIEMDATITCSICGNSFYVWSGTVHPIEEIYGVESIPGLSATLWTNSSGEPFDEANKICYTCTDEIAQAYLATLNSGDISSSGSTGSVPIEISAEASTFSVTVPTSIPLNVDANAAVTCANNLKIINNSPAVVYVQQVKVQDGDWSITDFNGGDRSSLASAAVNSNKLGIALTPDGGNRIATSGSGTQYIGGYPNWAVASGGELGLQCEAIATAVSEAKSNVQAASVVFTVGWNEAS